LLLEVVAWTRAAPKPHCDGNLAGFEIAVLKNDERQVIEENCSRSASEFVRYFDEVFRVNELHTLTCCIKIQGLWNGHESKLNGSQE
jgi:hypothetical protein